MSDQGFPGDRTEIRSRERRKVPSVTDVVDAVARSREIPPERRPEVFKAAQQVCAEELRLARTGFAPASLAELVDRAVMLLPRDLGGERLAIRGWDEDAPFSEEPLPEVEPIFSPEDPFGGEPALAGEWMEEAVERAAAPRPDAEPAPEPEPEAEREEAEAPEEIEFATAEESPAAASGGRLVAVLLVLAIAGGVWFFARTKRAPAPPAGISQPPPASAILPAPASAILPPTATPGPLPAPAAGPSAAPPPSLPTSAAASPGSDAGGIPESRGSAMISPDWSGRRPAWMIHFSSFQRKENADRDAARLGKLLDRPLSVISVNLGKPGLWYRVMLGEYASREEAQAQRDALAAKGTPGVGLVYRVTAP